MAKPQQINVTWIMFVLFPLALLFNLEFNILGVSGGGERIGHAASLVDGELQTNSSQSFPLKLSDLCFAIGAFWLIRIFRASDWKLKFVNVRLFALFTFFFISSCIGYFTSQHLYTFAQIGVAIAYFIKFSLVFALIPIFVALINAKSITHKDLRRLCFVLILASCLGIIDSCIRLTLEVRLFSVIIPDRIQYYGILGVALIYLLHIVQLPRFYLHRQLVFLTAFLISVAILLCGKRTLLLAFVISIGIPLFGSMRSKRSLILMITLIIFGIIMMPFVVDIERAFGREGDSLSAGLSPFYAEIVNNSVVSAIPISGLDYSLTERIAKWIYAGTLFLDASVFGVGFWGTPYAHNFIPDNGFVQIVLDTGVIGSFLFVFMFGYLTGGAIRLSKTERLRPPRAVTWFLCVIALTANPFYIFNLISFIFSRSKERYPPNNSSPPTP